MKISYLDCNMKALKSYEKDPIRESILSRLTDYDWTGIDGYSETCRNDMSRMKPDPESARMWAEQFRSFSSNHLIFLVGMGDGTYIRALLKQLKERQQIVIYEPNQERAAWLMKETDLSELLSNPRFYLLVGGLCDDIVGVTMELLINYENCRNLFLGMLPGYERETELYAQLKRQLEYYAQMVYALKITEITLARQTRENVLMNTSAAVGERSLQQLLDYFDRLPMKEIPGIVVSAGPSLDRNIHELKKAKGHALIVGVDTAMKALLRAGIEPDVMACVDPRKELVFFENEGIRKIPAIFDVSIPHQIVEQHEGLEFYEKNFNGLLETIAQRNTGAGFGNLRAGGSVANVAFSFLVKAGCKTIILVGQDLAFTDGKGHTKDAYDDDHKNEEDARKQELHYCEVEGIDGKPIRTEVRMKAYRDWFEAEIVAHPEVCVVDATEGGAKIHGTKIMTLQEALKTYMSESCPNWEEEFRQIPPKFSPKEQSEIRKYLKKSPAELDGLDQKLCDGILAYEELLRIAGSAGPVISPELRNKLSKANELDMTEPWMDILQFYAKEMEYEALDAIEEGDSANDELASIAANSIRLLTAYRKGIEALREDLPLLLDRL